MYKSGYRWLWITLVLCLTLSAVPAASQAADPVGEVIITSPAKGSVLGGVVSILGTVDVEALGSYTVAFGVGDDPNQWITILEPRQAQVKQGRLAFWDTTKVPDGRYSLRLRAVQSGASVLYKDYFVRGLLISNAPETATPVATLVEPTATLLPTATPTSQPLPTLGLDDISSPYLYVTLVDQADPLCPGWRQSYSIWVSNMGMMTLTQVLITDTIPADCEINRILVSKGNAMGDDGSIQWQIGDMAPGEAHKLELRIDVPNWLSQEGVWLSNKVEAQADGIEPFIKYEHTLFSDCPWLKQTVAAQPFVMPTQKPSVTPTKTSTKALFVGPPTLRPTPTVFDIGVTPETVEQSLDLLTTIIAVVLVILLILTVVLLYRRFGRR